MKQIIGVLALTSSVLSGGVNAAVVTLYQNDFDSVASPTFTTNFGSTEVVGPVLGNTTNSLAFNSFGNTIANSSTFYYDQIRYGINTTFPKFNVSFDIATDGLSNSSNQFVVFFDTPQVRNLVFRGNGDIAVQNFGGGNSGVIGSYSDQASLNVNMGFDIQNNLWNIFIDGNLLYSDIIDASGLSSIRFSQGALNSNQVDFNATTYIDNINISAVPVPAAVWLFGSGLIGLLGFKRSKTNS